ncbi:MAG: ABC transporter substrate-binding protein [Archaeoglobaceae archaeon]|nr:ABC transporter substrate-binding protein [Archaeoglobaceae archaeon]MCX8152558.1 ABC transporter substrate-binding protein [Archaeoglobaceae archaeon]MDW8014160.1 ABC transporter substrate-binding protein [Archaeoglobaceae archaeon]
MKRSILVILILALLIFCAEKVQQEDVRVSYQPTWHHVALFVIVEKGWDKKVLGKELKITKFPTGPEQMSAFAAGEHDIAYVGAAPPLSLIARGYKAKIVAVANVEGSSIISQPDLVYDGPKSFEGKTVMTFPPGSIQHTLLLSWLKESGVDLNKVNIKFGDAAEIREALRARAIDLGFVPDPTPYIALKEGYAKILIHSKDFAPNHPCCVILMREDFISKENAKKFLALHIIASEYASDPKNKDEIEKILIKWLGIREDVAETFPGTTNLQTDPRNKEWLKGLQKLCYAQYEAKLTKNEKGEVILLKTEDIVYLKLYEEALELVPKIKKELGL